MFTDVYSMFTCLQAVLRVTVTSLVAPLFSVMTPGSVPVKKSQGERNVNSAQRRRNSGDYRSGLVKVSSRSMPRSRSNLR